MTVSWGDHIEQYVYVDRQSESPPVLHLSGSRVMENVSEVLELRRLRDIGGRLIDEERELQRSLRQQSERELQTVIDARDQRIRELEAENELLSRDLLAATHRLTIDDWRSVHGERSQVVRYLDSLRTPIDTWTTAREIERGDHWAGSRESDGPPPSLTESDEPERAKEGGA